MSQEESLTKWYIALAVLIIAAIAINIGYQHGQRLLKDVHPWDYIADAILLIAFIAVIYLFNKKLKKSEK